MSLDLGALLVRFEGDSSQLESVVKRVDTLFGALSSHMQASTKIVNELFSGSTQAVKAFESAVAGSAKAGAAAVSANTAAASSAQSAATAQANAARETFAIQETLYARTKAMAKDSLAAATAADKERAASARAAGKVQEQAAKEAAAAVAAQQSALSSLGGTLSYVGIVAGAVFGSMAKSGVDMASKIEQSHVAFEHMLGSAAAADDMVADLIEMARTTPFDLDTMNQTAQRLLSVGFASEQIIPMIRGVGDAVAGVGRSADTVRAVTFAMGQIMAAGHLTAQDMRQLTETMTFSWQNLADHMGVSVDEAMKMVKNRSVESATVLDAYFQHSAENFAGMMAKQSKTFAGELETFKDTVTLVLADVFEPAKESLRLLLDEFNYGSTQMQQFVVGGVAVAAGLTAVSVAALKAAQFVQTMNTALGFADVSMLKVFKSGGLVAAAILGVVLAIGAAQIAWDYYSDTQSNVLTKAWEQIKAFLSAAVGGWDILFTGVRDGWLSLLDDIIYGAMAAAKFLDSQLGTSLSWGMDDGYNDFQDWKDSVQNESAFDNVGLDGLADGLGNVMQASADGFLEALETGVKTIGGALTDAMAIEGIAVNYDENYGPQPVPTFTGDGAGLKGDDAGKAEKLISFDEWLTKMKVAVDDSVAVANEWVDYQAYAFDYAWRHQKQSVDDIVYAWDEFDNAWDKMLKTSTKDIEDATEWDKFEAAWAKLKTETSDIMNDLRASFKYAANELGRAIVEEVDGLSQVINGAAEGAAAGGPIGAVIGAIVALLMQSEQFKRLIENLGEVVGAAANLIGSVFAPMLDMLSEAATLAADALNMIAGAIGELYGAIGGLFDKLGDAIGDIDGDDDGGWFQTDKDVRNNISDQISAVEQANAANAADADAEFQAAFDAWLASGEETFEYGLLTFEKLDSVVTEWDGVMTAWMLSIASLVFDSMVASGSDLSDVTGVTYFDPTNSTATNQGVSSALEEMIADYVGASEENTDALEELTESLTNIPDGYKAALGAYNAADAETVTSGFGSDDLSSMFGGTASWESRVSTGSGFDIPHFAAGGIVSSPTVGLIGEAGPEAIIPLDQLSSGGGGGNIYIEHLEVLANDPDDLFDQLASESRRRNMAMSGTANARRSGSTFRRAGGG